MTDDQIVERLPFPIDALDVIERIISQNIEQLDKNPAENAHSYLLCVATGGYLYGVMQGKRMERARRKGKAAAEKGVQPCKA